MKESTGEQDKDINENIYKYDKSYFDPMVKFSFNSLV